MVAQNELTSGAEAHNILHANTRPSTGRSSTVVRAFRASAKMLGNRVKMGHNQAGRGGRRI
jgi:hypothetical protein